MNRKTNIRKDILTEADEQTAIDRKSDIRKDTLW